MINKITSDIESVLRTIPDGATIMTSGFGTTGQPEALLEALIDIAPRELTIINNNASSGPNGLTKLFTAGLVKKLVCSFPKSVSSTVFPDLYRAGKIELELVPQGNLACRIQAAGAGLGPYLLQQLTVQRLLKVKKQEPSMVKTMYWNIHYMPILLLFMRTKPIVGAT